MEQVQERQPVVGITLGDVAGVGPEIIVKALQDPAIYEKCAPLVIGDGDVVNRAVELLPRAQDGAGTPLEVNLVSRVADARFQPGTVDVFEVKNIDLERLEFGQVSAMAGKAAFEYVETAVRLALTGRIDAICTAPLNKEALNKAGYHYPGHTEILAKLAGVRDCAMMLVAGSLRVIHVTTHMSLLDVCRGLNQDRVKTVIRIAHDVVQRLGVASPRIAVAGLNPHASEQGLFGDEEARVIIPAVEDMKAAGLNVTGPWPPDTVFLRAYRGEFDIVVAMYHDQGHIPVKMLGFESGVNITAGLPIIRTSVDHGTAFDIAWKGIANPRNMREAIDLAALFAQGNI